MEQPNEAQVRESLDRVMTSEEFSRSRRLGLLLEYLVTQSLMGASDRIKATSIAIDVFGRDESFDQQGDPIVRVEAGRLRNRLAEYYSGTGAENPLLIEIPKGAYVPRFSLRQITPAGHGATRESSTAPVGGGRRNVLLGFAAGVILALMLSTSMFVVYKQSAGGSDSQANQTFLAGAGEGRPYIVVNPVAANPGDSRSERLAEGLAEALITSLSKISGLSVMAHASVLKSHQQGEALGIADFRSMFGVTHMFRGTIEREGDLVVVNMQLLDARNAEVLWADRSTQPLTNIIELEEQLALTIAQQLAVQLRPDERERLSQYHSASSEAWLFYRQGLVTIMPPRDLVRVQAARQLFDRASQVDQSFAGGYAGHSFAHSTRVLFMNSTDPGLDLANARSMANKAIDLDSDFGAGYAMLAFAQILAGERGQAIATAQKAVVIQPGDAFARFIVGMSLIISEQPASAIPHLLEALRLDPLESRTPYLNVLGIAYYAAEDYSNAASTFRHNNSRGGPLGPHVALFLAASHAQLGEEQLARELFSSIWNDYPDFSARDWIARWVTTPELLEETLAMLKLYGPEA